MFLATNRNHVTGYEICPTLLEFANFRKDKFGLNNVAFTHEFPEEALREADCVIAIDVLEHIEDLAGFLKKVGAAMKTEAKLYHADSFLDKRAMHFDHSDKIHEYLREAGLFKIDTSWAIKGAR